MDEPKQLLATDPDLYEHFMGRWSVGLADPFLDFAAIPEGHRVLDVGCGTGVITLALARRGCAAVGTDASEAYLDGARRLRSHEAVAYEQADARSLPYPTASFDACVSTLAIDVVPEPEKVAAEMRRITRPGGIVACGTFDFWGGTSAMQLVVDTGATIDDGLRALRDYLRSRPLVWRNGQAQLWQKIGLIRWLRCPLCSALIIRRSMTIGPVTRPVPADARSACRKCRRKGETSFAASSVLATSLACQTAQDHSRP